MADRESRPEATHRQRASIGAAPEVLLGPDGRRYAVLTSTASDLVPTVQFGNVLVGPVAITRAVPVDPTPEEAEVLDAELAGLIERARAQQKAVEFVVGAERRVIQWALDPSTRVVNPGTGVEVTPDGDKPAGAADGAAPAPDAAAEQAPKS